MRIAEHSARLPPTAMTQRVHAHAHAKCQLRGDTTGAAGKQVVATAENAYNIYDLKNLNLTTMVYHS